MKASLFRSQNDAALSNNLCLMYECQDEPKISKTVKHLKEASSFPCYVRTDQPNNAYLESERYSWLWILTFCAVSGITYYIWKRIKDINYIAEFAKNLHDGKVNRCRRVITYRNVNTELEIKGYHLPPLIIATIYGHLDIMEYLAGIGANLNYVDKVSRKTVFHFACERGEEDLIYWCIQHGAPINATDNTNKTPLLVYLGHAFNDSTLGVVEDLIDAGADVNMQDDTGCNALYHACHTADSMFKSGIIAALITAGCVAQNTKYSRWSSVSGLLNMFYSFYLKTPFCSLLTEKAYDLCFLLIEAGYELQKDSKLTFYLNKVPSIIRNKIETELSNPAPLERICRTRIRNTIGGIQLRQKLEDVTDSPKILKFLQLHGAYSDDDDDDDDT